MANENQSELESVIESCANPDRLRRLVEDFFQLKESLKKEEKPDVLEDDDGEEREPSSKKQKTLTELDVSPSKCTWKDLQEFGIVNDYDTDVTYFLIINNITVQEIDNVCSARENCDCLERMRVAFKKENEGYPTVLLSLVLTHIVSELNNKKKKCYYQTEIFPNISCSYSSIKRSDYCLYKISCSGEPLVVIEVKSTVSQDINATNDFKKMMAQLYCEVYHLHASSSIVAILTDANVYHLFVISVGRKPFQIEKYANLNRPHIGQICTYMQYFIDLSQKTANV